MMAPKQYRETATQTWGAIAVNQFFQHINWSGKRQSSLDRAQSLGNVPHETVGHFFATLAWHGGGSTSMPTGLDTITIDDDLEQLTTGENSMTLEDLSVLF